MSNCPECGTEISRARSCGCGWKAKSARELAKQLGDTLGYTQCEWMSGKERCRYPGTMSPSTHGIGPNYCSGHFGCEDPVMGTYIVEASRDYRHVPIEERVASDKARLNTEAAAYLANHGIEKQPGESSRAYVARLRAHVREKFGLLVKQQHAA